MQMIKFISCPSDLIDKDVLKETINYFADKDGFKIKKIAVKSLHEAYNLNN